MSRMLQFYLAMLAIPLGACAADVNDSDDMETTSAEEELAFGYVGASARELNQFLKYTGYLPNEELSKADPAWRPVITVSPREPSVFDEATELAVKAMQRQHGLVASGVVDAATRDLMEHRVCGTPESGAVTPRATPGDKVEKYAVENARTKSTLTWKISNIEDCPSSLNVGTDCTEPTYQQISAALAQWSSVTSLSFREATGTTDLTFTWIDPCKWTGQTGCIPAGFAGQNNPVGSEVVLLNRDWGEWWMGGRLKNVVEHEVGHAIGIHHSSVPACIPGAKGRCTGAPYQPLMVSTLGPYFTEDDMNAANALYPKWEQLPGCARDIGSVPGATWIIGCEEVPGGHSIKRWNGSNWDLIPGGADRIAVNPSNGAAWVTNNLGQIFYSTYQSDGTHTFTQFPGCATDIAFSPSGWPVIIGCDAQDGGFGIYSFGCVLECSWVQIPGAAVNITVGKDDEIWVTNSNNNIYRRRGGGSFELMPGLASDVSVSMSGSPWVIGMDSAPWNFSEQAAITGVGNDTPSRFDWKRSAGRDASRVAVDSQHVWFAGSTIYRLKNQ